jgi:hypothetical protein
MTGSGNTADVWDEKLPASFRSFFKDIKGSGLWQKRKDAQRQNLYPKEVCE